MENGEHTLVIDSFGVVAEVVVDDPDLMEDVREVLPPGWTPGDPALASTRFTLTAAGDVTADGEKVCSGADRPAALGALDVAIRARVALHASGHIFVHAGVVACDDRALVMPAPSYSGKSALVAALVKEGAEYFSDEFAVLDPEGLVHPYAKSLSIRPYGTLTHEDVPVAGLGGVAGDRPTPVAVIAVTAYVPRARWDPRRATPAEGALALLSNTIPARSRPAQALAVLRRAASQATVLEGTRGEAEPTARALLELLRG